jgi:hypothetical protein
VAPRAKRTSKKASAKKSNVIEITFGDDYEPPTSEYFGEEPRPGVYRFRAIRVEKHTKEETGSETVHWAFSCEDEPYAGWTGHMYTGLPGSESFYRTQHIVRALQGGTTKDVTLNLDNPEAFLKKAKVVLGRVMAEEYNGDIRGRLSRVAPDDGTVKSTKPSADDEDDEFEDDGFEEEDDEDSEEDFDEEDEDDDEDEEDEDDEDDEEDDEEDDDEDDDEEDEEPEPPAKKSKAKSKAKPVAKKAPAKPAKKAAARKRR